MNRLLPRPVPGLVGIAGLVLYGWGLSNLIQIGSCSSPPSDGLPACPPGSEKFFFAVFAGLFVAIPAVVAGGGTLLFAGIFLTTGLSAIAAGRAEGSAVPGLFTLLFGGSFLAVPLLLFAGAVVMGLKRRKVARLVETGIEAIGTVLSVEDTGVTVNMNPRLRMRFRVEPVSGFPPPFEAEKTATVPRIALPRPGDRYPVWIDPADHTRWAFGSGAPDSTATPAMRRLFDLAREGARPRLPAPDVPIPGETVSRLDDLNRQRLDGRLTDQEFALRAAAELGYLPPPA